MKKTTAVQDASLIYLIGSEERGGQYYIPEEAQTNYIEYVYKQALKAIGLMPSLWMKRNAGRFVDHV